LIALSSSVRLVSNRHRRYDALAEHRANARVQVHDATAIPVATGGGT